MSMIKTGFFPRLSFKNLPEKIAKPDCLFQSELERVAKNLIPVIKTHNIDRIKT